MRPNPDAAPGPGSDKPPVTVTRVIPAAAADPADPPIVAALLAPILQLRAALGTGVLPPEVADAFTAATEAMTAADVPAANGVYALEATDTATAGVPMIRRTATEVAALSDHNTALAQLLAAAHTTQATAAAKLDTIIAGFRSDGRIMASTAKSQADSDDIIDRGRMALSEAMNVVDAARTEMGDHQARAVSYTDTGTAPRVTVPTAQTTGAATAPPATDPTAPYANSRTVPGTVPGTTTTAPGTQLVVTDPAAAAQIALQNALIQGGVSLGTAAIDGVVELGSKGIDGLVTVGTHGVETAAKLAEQGISTMAAGAAPGTEADPGGLGSLGGLGTDKPAPAAPGGTGNPSGGPFGGLSTGAPQGGTSAPQGSNPSGGTQAPAPAAPKTTTPAPVPAPAPSGQQPGTTAPPAGAVVPPATRPGADTERPRRSQQGMTT